MVPWRDFRPHRVLDLYRVYAGDTWRVGPRLTVNAGLAWSYEPNALNHDLTKPALLIPILGSDGLSAPDVQLANFSPTMGFAWMATDDGKTVVRGGAGRYFDPAASNHFNNFRNERHQLSPLGTGNINVPGSSILLAGRHTTIPTASDRLHRRAASLDPARPSRRLAADAQPGQPRLLRSQHRLHEERRELFRPGL